ncbi:hyaluronidase-1-like [Acipenser ruthenus]|uniref:hyaluronidase-1-like n=1 Tax=Acipenser ruthenus TaxID=7906 RepID=UPI002740D9E1|nr:hyaluronidase-1-like [Acipenser ruthenus]
MTIVVSERPGLHRAVLLCLTLLSPESGTLQPARAPLLPEQPFLVLWGVPDALCQERPDPSSFGMVTDTEGALKGGGVTMFYEDSLGLYPYFDSQNRAVAGGLPQQTNLEMHLLKSEADILSAIPALEYRGLGVIRWEEWWPQWSRNRAKKEIYQEQSRGLLQQFFPDWSRAELDQWAQVDFEAAAQAVLLETLQNARTLRPDGLWGFHPYPDCHNSPSHTSCCPATEMALNDELLWLWKKSSALYPSLQLDKALSGTEGTRLYTSNQIREALRVGALAGGAHDLPVFPFVRSVYTATNSFLSQADLVYSVGESAAMGAAGIVIWEKFFPTKNQRGCWDLADFVRRTLGPYVVNVTTAARLCGEALCGSRGRCVRKDLAKPVYLHLPPASYQLLPDTNMSRGGGGVSAQGQLQPGDLEAWRERFKCQWFQGMEEGPPADDGVVVKTGVNTGVKTEVNRGVGTGVKAKPTPASNSPDSIKMPAVLITSLTVIATHWLRETSSVN